MPSALFPAFAEELGGGDATTGLLYAAPSAGAFVASGIELAQVAGAPALGNLEAGAVASLLGLCFSIISGGVACVVGTALIAAALPGFVCYHRPRT